MVRDLLAGQLGVDAVVFISTSGALVLEENLAGIGRRHQRKMAPERHASDERSFNLFQLDQHMLCRTVDVLRSRHQ